MRSLPLSLFVLSLATGCTSVLGDDYKFNGSAVGTAGASSGAAGDAGAPAIGGGSAGTGGSPTGGSAGAGGVVIPPNCGNGVLDKGEACDGAVLGGATCSTAVGKDASGKLGCADDCQFDTTPCFYCGDGQIDGAAEACDGTAFGLNTCASVSLHPDAAGNLACTSACTIDVSGCSFCGDGAVNGSEACDGANLQGNTCASALMKAATGALACTTDCTFDSTNCQFCGDGHIGGNEQCDGAATSTCDQVLHDGDPQSVHCSADCRFDTSNCNAPTTCLNGTIDEGEQCDGTSLGDASCATVTGDVHATGTLSCLANCSFDPSGCLFCGDGLVKGTEACDGYVQDETCDQALKLPGGVHATGVVTCANDCTAFDTSGCSYCGDGVRNGNELCDGTDIGTTCKALHGGVGDLGCDATCTTITAGTCQWCGDGVRDNGEDCEGSDLNNKSCVDFDGADATGTLGCTTGCTFTLSGCLAGTACGNGVLDAGEECDSTASGHGDESCAIETGVATATGTATCNDQCHYVTSGCQYCGNGVIDGDEQCDGAAIGNGVCAPPQAGTPSCTADCKTDTSTCTCETGRTACPDNMHCVTLATDALNCGACGDVCGGALTCSGGVCAPTVVATADPGETIVDFTVGDDGIGVLSTLTGLSASGGAGGAGNVPHGPTTQVKFIHEMQAGGSTGETIISQSSASTSLLPRHLVTLANSIYFTAGPAGGTTTSCSVNYVNRTAGTTPVVMANYAKGDCAGLSGPHSPQSVDQVFWIADPQKGNAQIVHGGVGVPGSIPVGTQMNPPDGNGTSAVLYTADTGVKIGNHLYAVATKTGTAISVSASFALSSAAGPTINLITQNAAGVTAPLVQLAPASHVTDAGLVKDLNGNAAGNVFWMLDYGAQTHVREFTAASSTVTDITTSATGDFYQNIAVYEEESFFADAKSVWVGPGGGAPARVLASSATPPEEVFVWKNYVYWLGTDANGVSTIYRVANPKP